MMKRGKRTFKKYFCSDTQTGNIVEQTILSSLSAKGDGKSYIDNINLCYQLINKIMQQYETNSCIVYETLTYEDCDNRA